MSIFRKCFSLALLSASWMAIADEPPCAGSDLTMARSAASGAKAAVDHAITAIDAADDKTMKRLSTWFGVKNSAEMQQVRQTFVASRVFLDGAVFLCSVKTDIKIGDVYAYVRSDKSFVITLGAFFLSAPETGYDSKLGVIIHEMTHFVLAGATKDKTYGVSGAKSLAASDPAAARKNADNYEYFTESVHFGL